MRFEDELGAWQGHMCAMQEELRAQHELEDSLHGTMELHMDIWARHDEIRRLQTWRARVTDDFQRGVLQRVEDAKHQALMAKLQQVALLQELTLEQKNYIAGLKERNALLAAQ